MPSTVPNLLPKTVTVEDAKQYKKVLASCPRGTWEKGKDNLIAHVYLLRSDIIGICFIFFSQIFLPSGEHLKTGFIYVHTDTYFLVYDFLCCILEHVIRHNKCQLGLRSHLSHIFRGKVSIFSLIFDLYGPGGLN